MQNKIVIREAVLEDFNTINKFVNELEGTIFETGKLQKAFELNIKNDDFVYLIAELEEKPVGFVSCHSQNLLHHGGQKIGEIQEIYVRPENRKTGVGKELIDKLKSIVKQKGFAQLEVTSNKNRAEAHEFYIKEKFINSHEKFVLELCKT